MAYARFFVAMVDWSAHLLVFCLISIWLLLIFVTAFALAEPMAFIRWAEPLQLLSNHFFRDRAAKFASMISGAVAVLSLAVALILSFVLGGWFVTAAFSLLNSPYADWVFP